MRPAAYDSPLPCSILTVNDINHDALKRHHCFVSPSIALQLVQNSVYLISITCEYFFRAHKLSYHQECYLLLLCCCNERGSSDIMSHERIQSQRPYFQLSMLSMKYLREQKNDWLSELKNGKETRKNESDRAKSRYVLCWKNTYAQQCARTPWIHFPTHQKQ